MTTDDPSLGDGITAPRFSRSVARFLGNSALCPPKMPRRHRAFEARFKSDGSVVAVVVAIPIAIPVLSIPVSISFVAAASVLTFISHWVILEIVGIGMDRADVVLIMIAVIVTHALAVKLLLTGILGLIACFRELRTNI